MIQERWSAIVDGIYSLEPQRIRLSGLGQSCDLQLLRTTGYDHECSGSTLGTLERCQRPVPVQTQRATACSRRIQRLGRRNGRLERYTDSYKVPKHV